MNRMMPSRTLQILLLVVLATSFIITADSMTIVAQTGDPWIVAIDRSYAPHEFWEDETAKGFNTDIIRAIAIEMNREVVWVPLQWTDAYNSLLNGSVDSLCMVNTPEREILFDFSEPILNLTLRIFVREDTSAIFSLADLAEHTVAVEDGDIAHIKLLELNPNVTVVPVESQSEAIRLVADDEVTAAFCNSYTGFYTILKNSYNNVKSIGNPVPIGTRSIAVLDGNTVLRNQIDVALNHIFDSGEYEIIVERWFGSFPYIVAVPIILQALPIIGTVFLVSVISVGAVLTWNWSLRTRVKKSTQQLHLLGDLFRHDLRNIGQGAFGSLEILLMRNNIDLKEKEMLEMALSALERANMLTSDYSAIEVLSTRVVNIVELELTPSLESTINRLQKEFPAVKVNISYNHPAETQVVTVELLEEALYRVLRFLISQSIESGYEKIIDINTSVNSGVVLVSIGNHGPGIPDGQKAAALERYRGSQAPHVGLDLSMVHAVIKASKGHVEIHDTVPGDWKKGITFQILLQIPNSSRLRGVRQRFLNRWKNFSR